MTAHSSVRRCSNDASKLGSDGSASRSTSWRTPNSSKAVRTAAECCPLFTTTAPNARSASSAQTTGASLMDSGRVPAITSTVDVLVPPRDRPALGRNNFIDAAATPKQHWPQVDGVIVRHQAPTRSSGSVHGRPPPVVIVRSPKQLALVRAARTNVTESCIREAIFLAVAPSMGRPHPQATRLR